MVVDSHAGVFIKKFRGTIIPDICRSTYVPGSKVNGKLCKICQRVFVEADLSEYFSDVAVKISEEPGDRFSELTYFGISSH